MNANNTHSWSANGTSESCKASPQPEPDQNSPTYNSQKECRSNTCNLSIIQWCRHANMGDQRSSIQKLRSSDSKIKKYNDVPSPMLGRFREAEKEAGRKRGGGDGEVGEQWLFLSRGLVGRRGLHLMYWTIEWMIDQWEGCLRATAARSIRMRSLKLILCIPPPKITSFPHYCSAL